VGELHLLRATGGECRENRILSGFRIFLRTGVSHQLIPYVSVEIQLKI
jgi:hypothetical protein